LLKWTRLMPYCGTYQREERPHVEKRSILSCDSSFDNYCLNNGQCLFLVDLNENHCKCELGYLGTRCEHTQLVVQPMKEEEVALIIVCVVLLILGLTGALYFFCKCSEKRHINYL
uniref:EGF-like domain-containing protein n=1 Tax=Periophthalmus magnuspinnatus TaxID=409849 RepID=A0A3B4AMJ7_9GOBI